MEIPVLAFQLAQSVSNLRRTLSAALGKGTADDRQRCIRLSSRPFDKILADIVHNGFHIVMVAAGCRLIAFTLMPEQTFNVIVLRQLRQTFVYLLAESPEQRPLFGIDTPKPTVRAILTCGVDSRASHRLLDDVERLLPTLFQQIIDDGIEPPAPFYTRLCNARTERCKLTGGRFEITAAITPLAIVVFYIFR